MSDMGKHASNDRALRRARFAAWTVFLSMCGTTIAFQVYHSVKFGQMPTLLAVLFGVVLLVIAVCVLEFVTEWHGSHWWVKGSAYALLAGSMYMSAGSTGDVVVHAAPPHMSLLFGFLLDGAALLSVHFLLNGPRALTKAQEAEVAERAAQAAAAARREAAVLAAADADRAELEAAMARREAELQAVVDAEREARRVAESDTETLMSELATARGELVSARGEAAEALTRAEAIAQKLAAMSDRKARTSPRVNAQASARESAQGDDTTTELRALMELQADPELRRPRMGGELARRLGVSPATGRRLHSRLTAQDAPADPLGERSAADSDERSGERS